MHQDLEALLEKLTGLPKETEWVEFKHNFHSFDEVGETLSALANGACLHNQSCGYLVYGVEDGTHHIVGTDFSPSTKKKGTEEAENWWAQRLNPRVDFSIHEFEYQGHKIAMFQIDAATSRPVTFNHEAWIRVGSTNRKLRDFPEKERKIWKKAAQVPFEDIPATLDLDEADIVRLLDTQSYFDLLKLPYPSTRVAVIERLQSEDIIQQTASSKWRISNLGALLFAKKIDEFPAISRKAMRVIVYEGKSKVTLHY